MFKVVKEFKGSPDGCTVIEFKVGDKMSVEKHGQDLVNAALKEKWIVADKPQSPAKTPEQLKAEAVAKAQKKVDNLTKALEKAKTPESKAKVQQELDAANQALAALK